MKIVQINAVYEYSSTGRNVSEMHEHFLQQGIDSFVFTSDKGNPDKQVYLIGNKRDHKIHALYSRIWGLQGYFSKNATKRLIRQLSQLSPDVVILHNLHANYIHLPLLLTFLARENIATLLVLHDFWFITGHCCYYTEDKCYKWQTECHHCPLLHTYNKSLFFDRSRKIFKDKKRLFQAIPRLAVVGVSKWTIDEARQSFLKEVRILDFIYNWIDLDLFHPCPVSSLRVELGVNPSDFIVLGVSQGWSAAKGLNQFIEIARRMPHLKVVLVGRFPANVEVPHNIIIVGEVSSPQRLAEFYSMADVFVNPSIQETFGKVTAEALACGTPVIGSDTTATPELIPTQCGHTFSPNDTERLLNHITSIREEGKKAYSENCRRFATENFGKKRQIEKYIHLINEL